MKRSVVVTGLGCVSPFGVGLDLLWDNLIKGNSGIKILDVVDTSKHTVRFGGSVPDFDTSYFVDSKDARRMDKFILCGFL